MPKCLMYDLQGAGLLGLAAAFFGLHLEASQLAGILVSIGFVFTADQVLFCSPCLPSICQLLMSQSFSRVVRNSHPLTCK